MGYFSNGTEGDMYRDQYCFSCTHWKEDDSLRGEGCPVMDLHFLYNHDQLKPGGESIKAMLSMLIPQRMASTTASARCTSRLRRASRASRCRCGARNDASTSNDNDP